MLEWLQKGALSTGHAKVILGLEEQEKQLAAAAAVVENGLNVRQTEALCKNWPGPSRKKAGAAAPGPSERGGNSSAGNPGQRGEGGL